MAVLSRLGMVTNSVLCLLEVDLLVEMLCLLEEDHLVEIICLLEVDHLVQMCLLEVDLRCC